MRRKVGKKVISTVLTAALITSGFAFQTGDASAAKKVTKLTLNKKSATLYKGATKPYSSITLKATVKPKAAAKVKFTSSNKSVATVSSKGVVTAKKPGKVTITAKAGSKKAVCKITVKKISKKVKKITVKKSKVTVYVGKTSKISASVTPAKATLKKFSYKTSNTKVASVSAKGVIKGIKAGTATITVSAVDGSKKKATIKVTVKKKAATPTTAPTTQPTVAPTTVPTTEPSATPSTQPAASATPSAAPSTTPAVTATPVVPTSTPNNGGNGGNGGGGTTPSTTPAVTATPNPTTSPAITSGSVIQPTELPSGKLQYSLDKNTAYKLTYGDNKKLDVSVNDISMLIKNIATYAAEDGTAKSAYENLKKAISEATSEAPFTQKFDAGYVTTESLGGDKYKVTIGDVANTSRNGDYTVNVGEVSENGKITVGIVNDKDAEVSVNGTVNEITDNSFKAEGIVINKGGVDHKLSSVEIKLNDDGTVLLNVPKSDKLNNLTITVA